MNRRDRRAIAVQIVKKARQCKKRAQRLDREIAKIVSRIQSGKQVIGSIESILVIPEEPIALPEGLAYEFLPSGASEHTLAIYKKGSEPMLELYRKYEAAPNFETLSREEHAASGKAFGFSQDEIEWFLSEYDEEKAARPEDFV